MAADMEMANYYPHEGWSQLGMLYGFYFLAALIIGAAMVVLIRLARLR